MDQGGPNIFEKMPSSLYQYESQTYSFFFQNMFGGVLAALCKGKGGAPGAAPLHNLRVTSYILHQDVPRVVPGMFLVNYFWAFVGGLRGQRGRPWYGT